MTAAVTPGTFAAFHADWCRRRTWTRRLINVWLNRPERAA